MSDEEFNFCQYCGRQQCTWDIGGPLISNNFNGRYEGQNVNEKVLEISYCMRQRCFHLYQYYVHFLYGVLGKRVRVRISKFIASGIGALAPDPKNIYVGYFEIEEHIIDGLGNDKGS